MNNGGNIEICDCMVENFSVVEKISTSVGNILAIVNTQKSSFKFLNNILKNISGIFSPISLKGECGDIIFSNNSFQTIVSQSCGGVYLFFFIYSLFYCFNNFIFELGNVHRLFIYKKR
jgi:hypothetical protein